MCVSLLLTVFDEISDIDAEYSQASDHCDHLHAVRSVIQQR